MTSQEKISGLAHGIVVMWLDAYIGDPRYHIRLKAAFASNIDPTNPKPIELCNQHTNGGELNDLSSLIPSRIGIPCELKMFVDDKTCLECIDDSLSRDKRIFLIVSESMGQKIIPYIIEQYPEEFDNHHYKTAISFYIFHFYMTESIDWLFDYQDFALVFNHENDLLWRLVHDIAKYYAENGKKLFDRNTLIDSHQALLYFKWASALCDHAKSLTTYQDSKLSQLIEHWRYQAEEKVKNAREDLEKRQYSKIEMKKYLDNSLLIYCAKEFRSEAAELLSMLLRVNNNKGAILDDYDAYAAKLQTDHCTTVYYCPIVILSNEYDYQSTFNKLSLLRSVHRIYALHPNNHMLITFDDQDILKNVPKIRNIYTDIKRLTLEWTVEQASLCEKMGDICVENGDSDLARTYYERIIQCNEHLLAFVKKK